jgi:hypothetical protein
MKKLVIIALVVTLLGVAAVLYIFVFSKNLKDRIVIPYIAHQEPRIDPHVPSAVPIADKLDEVVFDGLFNVSANPSGIAYEDGLGELVGIDENNIVTVRLKPRKRWHSSFDVTIEKKKIMISPKQDVYFAAEDLKYTLRRIKKLGSLSPDYILVGQAVRDFDFSGPDENNEIQFQFHGDRVWSEADIKEVLSFKILPSGSSDDAAEYAEGTGPFLKAGEFEDIVFFYKNPAAKPVISNVVLKPFIDNSTYTTELRSRNINVLLSTPFGAVSPILRDTAKYFYKSSISTCFFALLHNVKRLSLEQRVVLRGLVNNRKIMYRFFKYGSEQQRHIANYRGNGDNYQDYLNYSMFPSTSYYVEEQVVSALERKENPNLSVLPDTVRVQTCVNYDFREELSALAEIINDPAMFGGKIKVSAVQNQEIAAGDYDAVLVAVSGYRSNFLFDLYDIFLREPDFSAKRINLRTAVDSEGKRVIHASSFMSDKNFFRLGLGGAGEETDNIKKLLDYIYSFMSTHEIGDKQAYAQFVDELEQQMALGTWLFSLPSLAYFNTQFQSSSIDLYGTASQLSTIEKWQEKPRTGGVAGLLK